MTNDPELSEKISSEDDQGVDQPQPFHKFQLEDQIFSKSQFQNQDNTEDFPKVLGTSWNHSDDKLVFLPSRISQVMCRRNHHETNHSQFYCKDIRSSRITVSSVCCLQNPVSRDLQERS